MQTFPGLQINWLLQCHPSSPGGEQTAAQPLPAAWGSGSGVQSVRTKPWHPGAPQAGSSLSLSVINSIHASLFFFVFFLVFFLCLS